MTKVPSKIFLRDGRAPLPNSRNISYVMSANKSKNTRPELKLRSELWKNNIRGYRLHKKNVPGRPDIAFIKKKIAVFVNGCFWHRCPKCDLRLPKSNTDFWKNKFNANVKRDKLKIKQLKKYGWRVMIFWECEINESIQGIVKKIGNKVIK